MLLSAITVFLTFNNTLKLNHMLRFNYYQTFHKWDAIYTNLFSHFIQVSRSLKNICPMTEKAQNLKNNVSKAYLVTPVGHIKNRF